MRLSREEEQELLSPNGFHGVYTLPSVAELDDEAGGCGGLHLETPLLVGGESYEFAAIANLDLFFTRVYRYWHERGLRSILLAGALNLLALAFTAAFSTFLLLFVDWRALHAECLAPRAAGGGGGAAADGSDGGAASRGGGGSCDLAAVALDRRPLLGRGFGADLLAVSYIAVCVVYLGWTAAHFLMDARDMREVAHFMANKLGISEGKVVTMTWAEVVHRLVLVQRTTRLCIARDLDELHIVNRIMRKENYLIAMLNRNVLQLHLQPPPDAPAPLRRVLGPLLRLLGGSGTTAAGGGGTGSGSGGPGGGGGGGPAGRGAPPPALTKTLEWNLRWCILDHMFDDRFRIRPEFSDVAALKRRLRLVAATNLLLSPFLLLFLLAYFFMRNAERLYHHPAALGSRRWSGAAKWRIRELNELPHYLHHRLSASHPAALRYVAQFPSHTLAALARFMVFVTGSFVALLLLMTFLDESLLERPLLGRQVVWWLGTMTVVLAACRTLVSEEPVAYDPERALADVVSYTHYLPRYWRGRAHTAEVQSAFLALFRLKVALFLEELASLITTPLVLACSLPACADSIVEFVSTFTAHIDGVGDVCSLATFDLARHGNVKYGAPVQAEKAYRSRQGKLEKSFLTFVATYPTWEPGEVGRRMLASLAANGGGAGAGTGAADAAAAGANAPAAGGGEPVPRPAADALPFHQEPPSQFPYQVAAEAGKAAADAASAAALTRAASGFRGAAAAKGFAASAAAAPHGQDGDGRAGDAAAAAPPLLQAQTRLPPPVGARAPRRPQIPLHLLPYHGVRSYMSNASASALSAAAGSGGWPWRQAANLSSGGSGGGPVGGSPPPSVASSQFSNLAAPYLQYYPVPLYYAQQQQVRHVQQQQVRRMYDHLMYGGPPPPGIGGGAAAAAAAAATLPSSPFARRMANSSASGGGGGPGWQHHSLPQPYDVYGASCTGVPYSPYPFQAPGGGPYSPFPYAPGPLSPLRAPHSHVVPQPGDGHPDTARAPADTAATAAGGGTGAAMDDGPAAPRPMGLGQSQTAAPVVPVCDDGGGRGGATRHLQLSSNASGQPSSAPPPSSLAAPLPTADGDGAGGRVAAAGAPRTRSTTVTEAGDGWGSGVSGISDRTGASRGPAAAAAAPAAVASTLADGGGVGSAAASSSAGGGAAVVGSGSATTGVGYGSDILDMRGVDMSAAAPSALAGGDDVDVDDPLGLGGFVELPPAAPPPAPPATALAAGLEDADGFGLVPEAARAPAAAAGAGFGLNPGSAASSSGSGLMPRRWGPGSGAGGGTASRLAAAALGSTAPDGGDADGVCSTAGWYDSDGRLPPPLPPQRPVGLAASGQQHVSAHHGGGGGGEQSPHGQHQQQHQQQQQGGLPTGASDPSSSQMYYSTDYYASGPYYGTDEYGMYGYDSGMPYGGADVPYSIVMAPPPLPPTALLHSQPHSHLHDVPHQHQLYQQTQQQLSQHTAAAAAALRASVFGAGANAVPPAATSTGPAGFLAGSLYMARSQGPTPTHAQASGEGGGVVGEGGVQASVLPLNETSQLQERVTQGHALLQSLYETSDAAGLHRRRQQQHQGLQEGEQGQELQARPPHAAAPARRSFGGGW